MAAFIIFVFLLFTLTILLYNRRVRQYYINESIFELRQAKHEIIIYMSEHAETISNKELGELKELLKIINRTISMFSKIAEKRFSTLKVVINSTVLSSDKIEHSDANIFLNHQALLKHFFIAIHTSLKAVPFLQLRVTSHIIKLFLQFLVLLGIRKAKRLLSKFERFIYAENNHFSDHCLN